MDIDGGSGVNKAMGEVEADCVGLGNRIDPVKLGLEEKEWDEIYEMCVKFDFQKKYC